METQTLKNEKKTLLDPKTGKFAKGNPGGPGYPKGKKHFATIFMDILKEKTMTKDGKMTIGKAMSLAMAKKAMRGDVPAFREVADRVDGKPSNSVDLNIVSVDDETLDGVNSVLAKFLDANTRPAKK